MSERHSIPVTYEEWQRVLNDIQDLKLKYGLMELNVTSLIANQAKQHEQNLGRIGGLERALNGEGPDSPGISGHIIAIRTGIETANQQNERWRKWSIAIITLLLGALGLWLGSLEHRGKVSKDESPAISRQSIPQDASIPVNP